MRSNPEKFVSHVYAAIGVDADFVPLNLGQRYNITQEARFAWVQSTIRRLAPRIMKAQLSPRLYNQLRSIRWALWRLNAVSADFVPMPPGLRQELVNEMSATIDYVEGYLGYPLPSWRET